MRGGGADGDGGAEGGGGHEILMQRLQAESELGRGGASSHYYYFQFSCLPFS